MKEVSRQKIKEIFEKNKITKVKNIHKIDIGFNNDLYVINDEFILKVCKKKSNEKRFQKEIFFYVFFKNKLPIPKVIFYDLSKKSINKPFMIYAKIEGENLYSQWHRLNNTARNQIIYQLCDLLKIINKSEYKEYIEKFNLKPKIDWHKNINRQINHLIKRIEKRRLLSKDFLVAINGFVKENHIVLKEQKLALVYWDVHFDNILVKKGNIVGLLDFEGVDVMSIDYVLHLVRRMVSYPQAFASKECENFIKKEDYVNVVGWFKEFYPELFNFKHLNQRLALYSIEYDLKLLFDWPKSKTLKERLAKTVRFKDN